jgi:hypothetical protein
MTKFTHSIAVAEIIVDNFGDYKKFQETFVKTREHYGVGISLEKALDEQGLWDQYENAIDTFFNNKF